MAEPCRPSTPEEVVALVRSSGRVLAAGAGTKPALSRPPAGCALMDLRGLSGIEEYQPQEFTFTALAGTPLREIQAELARQGQHLPFDPPFAEAGATLGGAIASGLSGPGRYRTGGLRDFILGVRFVTGGGELVRGGAKVVKNAAGFDYPKLLVGSLGRLGAIVEATMKVFPAPEARATLRVFPSDLASGLDAARRLGSSPFEIESLEIEASGEVAIRIAGPRETLAPRLASLEAFLGRPAERLEADGDRDYWRRCALRLPEDPAELLAKVPMTPSKVPAFDAAAARLGAARHYGIGGNLAWVRWPEPSSSLDSLLKGQGLSGLVVAGEAAGVLVGVRRGGAFLQRVKTALDPDGRFPELHP